MRTLTPRVVVCGLLAIIPSLLATNRSFAQANEQAQPGKTRSAAGDSDRDGDVELNDKNDHSTETAAAPAQAPVDTPPALPPSATGEKDPRGVPQSHAGPGGYGGPTTDAGDVWKFTYSGFFRAPMRVGISKRERTVDGQSSTSLHIPVVPDDQYLSWQHTRHNQRDWAEMFFTVGNAWASGTLGIQGFNFTDAAWADPQAQFGIAQGFVTLTPKLPWEGFRLIWRVGNPWGKYGGAGKYDAGEYDTFLFGRTKAMGEILRAELDAGDMTYFVEHGIGARRPNPSVTNRARFTLLHHAHAGFSWSKSVDVGLHYLTAWTQEEERSAGPYGVDEEGGAIVFSENGVDPIPDGRLSTYGADLRADLGSFGYLYAGFARTEAKYAFTVAPAYETIHSNGGGDYSLGIVDNYLEGPTGQGINANSVNPAIGTRDQSNPNPNPYDCKAAEVWAAPCSRGNGSVNTVLGQYELSLNDVAAGAGDGSILLGGGMDLTLKLYGMINWVKSDNQVIDPVRGKRVIHEHTKLKYGADLIWDILPALSFGARFDRLQPNNHVREQSFSIVSPRFIFRSQFVTREQIELQYSRYIYAQRECRAGDFLGCAQPSVSGASPEGFGSAPGLTQEDDIRGAPVTRPDENVIKLQASMWF